MTRTLTDTMVLGGAQMSGFIYGGLRAPMSRRQAEDILDAAWKIGVRSFDTAEGYGAGPQRLIDWLRQRQRNDNDIQIVTKVTSGGGFGNRAMGASQRFHPYRRIVLLHGLGTLGEWQLGRVGGFSLYTLGEVETMLKYARPARLQIPVDLLPLPSYVTCPVDVRGLFTTPLPAKTKASDVIRRVRDQLRPKDRIVVGVDNVRQLDAFQEAFEEA